MPANVTTDQVWREVEGQTFAVLAWVSGRGEARSAGIVYTVRDRQLFISTDKNAWKARHIERNPHVSMTVTIAKRLPFMPWVKIPAATITFQGDATVEAPGDLPDDILATLLHGLEADDGALGDIGIIRVKPRGDFVTYGIGVSLMTMRKPEQAQGRVAA